MNSFFTQSQGGSKRKHAVSDDEDEAPPPRPPMKKQSTSISSVASSSKGADKPKIKRTKCKREVYLSTLLFSVYQSVRLFLSLISLPPSPFPSGYCTIRKVKHFLFVLHHSGHIRPHQAFSQADGGSGVCPQWFPEPLQRRTERQGPGNGSRVQT